MPSPNDYFLGAMPYVNQAAGAIQHETEQNRKIDPELSFAMRAWMAGDMDAVKKYKLKKHLAQQGGGQPAPGPMGAPGAAPPGAPPSPMPSGPPPSPMSMGPMGAGPRGMPNPGPQAPMAPPPQMAAPPPPMQAPMQEEPEPDYSAYMKPMTVREFGDFEKGYGLIAKDRLGRELEEGRNWRTTQNNTTKETIASGVQTGETNRNAATNKSRESVANANRDATKAHWKYMEGKLGAAESAAAGKADLRAVTAAIKEAGAAVKTELAEWNKAINSRADSKRRGLNNVEDKDQDTFITDQKKQVDRARKRYHAVRMAAIAKFGRAVLAEIGEDDELVPGFGDPDDTPETVDGNVPDVVEPMAGDLPKPRNSGKPSPGNGPKPIEKKIKGAMHRWDHENQKWVKI